MINKVIFKSVLFTLVVSGFLFENFDRPNNLQLSYMKRFGYLPSSNFDAESTFTRTARTSMSAAITKLQKFAGLTETGFLNMKTNQLFSRRRCGRRDIGDVASRQRRFILEKAWKKRIITFSILSGTKQLSKSKVSRLIRKGFDLWSPYGNLIFVEKDSAPTDIEVSFTTRDHGDRFPFDGPGNIVAHAFPPPRGSIHFDEEEMWGEVDENSEEIVTDFYTVAAHEIGHALGLGHSPIKSSIMYPYYRYPTTLGDDDTMGMYELYLKNPPPDYDESATQHSASSSPAPAPEPTPTVETSTVGPLPNICDVHFDSIAVLHGQLFVFYKSWFWRFKERRKTDDWQPVKVHNYFRGLPANVTHIDAAYERTDRTVILFSDRNFWSFDTNLMMKHGTIDLFKIPPEYPNLEAVFVSNVNGKIYLFKYGRYWRLNETTREMDAGYPKALRTWRGFPRKVVSAVIVWKRDTFFFKGSQFWRFDNSRLVMHPHYPLPTAPIWFGCRKLYRH